MDVHDLENFGDLPSYPPGVGRPEPFGTCYLRLDLPLEPGWVVTVEPGFYVVPAILADPVLRERFAHMVDFGRAADWIGFGGIRIEDDIVVTGGAPENLTADIPRTVADVEALVGSGPRAEDLLGGLA
jgi:Xaa-Pro aminopeptidase